MACDDDVIVTSSGVDGRVVTSSVSTTEGDIGWSGVLQPLDASAECLLLSWRRAAERGGWLAAAAAAAAAVAAATASAEMRCPRCPPVPTVVFHLTCSSTSALACRT